jgi:hypothetical protein
MDARSKLTVFIVAGGALIGYGSWLFRKVFPPPPDDLTAPKGLSGGATGDYTESGHDHGHH